MPALGGLLPTSFGEMGQFLSGPLMQLLLGGRQIRQQNRLQDQYTADVDRQIADAMRVAGRVGPEVLNTYDASARNALNELLGLRPRQMRDAQSVIQGFRDRYNTAEADLKGYGKQQERDIDRRFDEDLASTMANLQERGIASTTAVGSQKNLNTERRSAEQRRLGEDLQRLRMSILPALSGDVLSAQQMGMNVDAMNTGNIANWFGSNAANRSNITGRGLDTILNTLMNINRVPPPPANVGQFGANMVDPVDYSKGQSSSAPWIQAGGSVAGAAIMATIFVGICIGEDSLIECEDGPKSLRDIKVGDYAMNANGERRKVIAKHFMPHKGDWQYHYRKLTIGENSIVASREHVIEGKRVELWIGDDTAMIGPPGPRTMVGDVLLEDGSDYVANGLRVSSLISHEDVDLLKTMEPENNGIEVEAY